MQKIILLLIAVLFISTVNVNAQTTTDTTSAEESDSADVVFQTVQIEAKFPGGVAGWQDFLVKTLKVNTPVKKHAPPGNYTVMISFIVLKDGSVKEIEVLQDPGYGTAEEVVRVMKKSPKWTPASLNGKNVIYRQKQSITFQVD